KPAWQRPRQPAADPGLVVVLALVGGVEPAEPGGERAEHQGLGRLLFPRGAVQKARYTHAAEHPRAGVLVRPIHHPLIIRDPPRAERGRRYATSLASIGSIGSIAVICAVVRVSGSGESSDARSTSCGGCGSRISNAAPCAGPSLDARIEPSWSSISRRASANPSRSRPVSTSWSSSVSRGTYISNSRRRPPGAKPRPA